MPYPAQTNRSTIVSTARVLIERAGVEQLSLAEVAAALGIKAPSLYRYVASRGALLQAVVLLTFQDLFAAYDAALAAAPDGPRGRLLAIFRAHRAFARANPRAYILAFTQAESETEDYQRILEQLAIPIQRLMAELVGEDAALTALRGGLAMIHGFVMLELNKQFRRGGDLDSAFEAAIAAYLSGWE
ncbi:MAG TPA: TetR/AcrR family transcriptional regulator [Herpetosiphonaceae bacterium]|nr:TetR/AcrR family transcriptional regulator [Herpetosiphonaceae bacterium]